MDDGRWMRMRMTDDSAGGLVKHSATVRYSSAATVNVVLCALYCYYCGDTVSVSAFCTRRATVLQSYSATTCCRRRLKQTGTAQCNKHYVLSSLRRHGSRSRSRLMEQSVGGLFKAALPSCDWHNKHTSSPVQSSPVPVQFGRVREMPTTMT